VGSSSGDSISWTRPCGERIDTTTVALCVASREAPGRAGHVGQGQKAQGTALGHGKTQRQSTIEAIPNTLNTSLFPALQCSTEPPIQPLWW